MIDIKTIQHIYFIGIGGIGMSALARYFHFHGKQVSGYDKTPGPVSRALETEGIAIHYTDDPAQIPAQTDLVVYTPAIPAGMKELDHCRQAGLPVLKRSEVLGIITAASYNICVAGTHGKTTISTMIAHILRDSGYGCNAFLGGIATNYNSNYWSSERELAVLEADEYDRSFLQLHPDIAVISSMDPDHLDIYQTGSNLEEAFVEFAKKLKENGRLLVRLGLEKHFPNTALLTYSVNDNRSDIYASEIKSLAGGYEFSVVGPGWTVPGLTMNMGGLHNMGNMIIAVAIAHMQGIDDEAIRKAVASFQGVKRRFERIAHNAAVSPTVSYIDDYAHHPGELDALISGARDSYPGHELLVIFQPHLYSRTKDFADGFAESLDKVDTVILLPIYPARELPMEGVSSEMIASRMQQQPNIIERDAIPEYVSRLLEKRKSIKPLLIVTVGAGDIDRLVALLKEQIEQLHKVLPA